MKTKQIIFVIAFSFIASIAAFAQIKTGNQTTADENFKLNITNKKVTEQSYESKVEVAVESETNPKVVLNIGAGVKAETITLRLTNITGDIRFRGSLEKILEKIKLRRPIRQEEN